MVNLSIHNYNARAPSFFPQFRHAPGQFWTLRLRIPNQVIDCKTRSHHKACHHCRGSFMMLMTWDNASVCERTTEFDPGSLREMPYRQAMNCLWMGPMDQPRLWRLDMAHWTQGVQTYANSGVRPEDGKYHRVDSWYNSWPQNRHHLDKMVPQCPTH